MRCADETYPFKRVTPFTDTTTKVLVRKINCLLLILAAASCSDSRIDQLELRVTNELRQMRSEIADQNNQIEELRGEIGSVTGKVEEVQHTASGKTEQLAETLKRMSSRVPPPAPVPEELLNIDEQLISRQEGAAADVFASGLRQLREGEFGNARDTFLRFAEENPDTAFTDNAYFWQGIAFEGLNQYDRAVAAFSLGFQRFPAEDRVPANLFYLAEVFEQMGQKKDAELTYEKLLDEHPKSDFAERAKKRLDVLRPPTSKAPAAKPMAKAATGSKKKY
jgi:tol-pal system protein YbgF